MPNVHTILQMPEFNEAGVVWLKFQQRDRDLVDVVRNAVHVCTVNYGISQMQYDDLCYQVLVAMQQKLGGI